jgi:hypothetical protein
MAAMRGNTLSLALVLAAGAVAASGCGENPVPERPTYSQHIKPILESRCIRCHGAGGTLNKDPDIPQDFNPNSGPPLGVLQIGSKGVPTGGNFTTYDGIKGYANGPAGPNILMTAFLPYMPPPPSDALSGWELDTFQAWLKNPLP